jgi:hypothetical protein
LAPAQMQQNFSAWLIWKRLQVCSESTKCRCKWFLCSTCLYSWVTGTGPHVSDSRARATTAEESVSCFPVLDSPIQEQQKRLMPRPALYFANQPLRVMNLVENFLRLHFFLTLISIGCRQCIFSNHDDMCLLYSYYESNFPSAMQVFIFPGHIMPGRMAGTRSARRLGIGFSPLHSLDGGFDRTKVAYDSCRGKYSGLVTLVQQNQLHQVLYPTWFREEV